MTPEQAQYLDEVEARAKVATPKTWKTASSWRQDSYSVKNEQGWAWESARMSSKNLVIGPSMFDQIAGLHNLDQLT